MSVADRAETGGDTCQAGYHAQIKAENRARIIRAARDLFLARGYDKTSLAQIAKEARVSTGTLFKRYPSKAALFAAQNDAVLHIATRRTSIDDGPALELADGNVSALEISARGRAPSLVVLSSCDAATAKPDEHELASSLIAAFLASGSQHVVATLLSVDDQQARAVATAFYRNDGVRSPARALQAAQQELVGTDNKAWPQFTVFGPDVCLEDASVPP